MRSKFVTHSVYYLRNPRIPYMYFLEYKRNKELDIWGFKVFELLRIRHIIRFLSSSSAIAKKKKRREKILGEM